MLRSLATATMLSCAVAIAGPALAAAAPATASGGKLVDAKGMTLYTFDKDTPGKSSCTGNCANNWPALTAPADANPSGNYTVVVRDDGSKQWAYNGKPLYTFAKDTKAGDTGGEGMANGAWHVAKP